LAPYLFLFVGEALNAATKHCLSTGELKHIILLAKVANKIINQFVDDTNFTITREERIFQHLANLLKHYEFHQGFYKLNALGQLSTRSQNCWALPLELICTLLTLISF